MEDNLASALAKAQAKMSNAAFNRVNPHFRSKYADLAAIRDATIPALSAHGLALIQYIKVDEDGGLFLHTRLAHQGGEYIESKYPLPIALDKPQVMGSALTYAKRYCWSSMCGIAADDDDDAEAATPKKSAHQARKDGDWEGMMAEMKVLKTPEELQAWGEANRDRIHMLPDNWQLHLKDEFARLMGLMNPDHPLKRPRGRPPKSAIKEQLKASVAALTAAEAIDDEIPRGIENPDKYLDDLESLLCTINDINILGEQEQEYIKNVKPNMFPSDRVKAEALFDRHAERIQGAPGNPNDA